LSGGQAHDCPPAQRLIRRSKKANKFLGDRAYDSAELRQWLLDRGTKPVIPNKSNASSPSASTSNPTNYATVLKMLSAVSKTSEG